MSKRGQRDVISVGALLFAWAIPVAAAAQSDAPTPIDEVRRNSRLHAGPLYAKPTLQLKELGIELPEGVLPLSNIPALVPPFFLRPNTVLALR